MVTIDLLTWVLIFALFSRHAESNVLTIEERPASGVIEALQKSTLKLTCLVPTSQILDRLYWFVPSRDDMHVTNTNVERSPYIQVERTIPPRVSLFVREFQSRDQGKYSCRFYDRSDASSRRLVAEESVRVTMVADIRVVTAEREQWLRNGAADGQIRCHLEGYPPPKITWIRNSVDISTDKRYSYTPTGLQWKNVVWADAGKYICRASRASDSKALDVFIDVRVYEKPRITVPPTVTFPMVLVNGEEAYLDCKGDGKPKPKIFWFKQNNPNRMLQQVDPQRYFVDENSGRLRIMGVDYSQDTDVFKCVAALTSAAIIDDVKGMMAEASQRLQVYLKPRFIQTDRPLNQWVDLGKTVSIICKAECNGNVRMQFQKFGSPFPYVMGTQPDDNRITVRQAVDRFQPLHHLLTLEIKNTRTEDSSNYTCIALNEAANHTVNGTILVKHKPIMEKNLTDTQMGWIRNATNLTCISYGLPHPTWTWSRHTMVRVLNGINLTFHIFSYDYFRHSQSWLQIKPDFGMENWIFDEYECVATNSEGQGSRTVYFQAASVPGPPRVLESAIKVTSSSISIRVLPPEVDGGMTVLYYLVRYQARASGRTTWYGPVEFPVNYTVDFSGLMSDTVYRFEIRARNLVGPSQRPAEVEKRTKPLQPPSKVQVISDKMSTYPYTYFLRWKVPYNGGEPIDGYRIRIRKRGSSGDWKEYRPLFNNPNLSEYFIVDLDAGTKFEMVFQAHSSKGYSPETRFDFETPPADSYGKPDRVRGGASGLGLDRFPFSLLFLAFFLRFFRF